MKYTHTHASTLTLFTHTGRGIEIETTCCTRSSNTHSTKRISILYGFLTIFKVNTALRKSAVENNDHADEHNEHDSDHH